MQEPRRYNLDWSSANEETAKLFLKQGELLLDAQLKLLLAADSRAMTTAAGLAALATGITAATVALFGNTQDTWVLWTGLPGAAMLVVAAIMASRVARPAAIGPVGTAPKEWWIYRDSASRVSLIGGELEFYQERIDDNYKLLVENGGRLQRALLIAASAPAIAIISLLLFRFLPRI